MDARLSRIPKSMLLALPFFLTGVVALAGAFFGSRMLAEFLEENPGAPDALARSLFKDPEALCTLLQICSVLLFVIGVVTCVRKSWALRIVRVGFLALYATYGAYVYQVVAFTTRLQSAQIHIDGEPLTGSAALNWYVQFLWFVLVLAIIAAMAHLQALRSSIADYYGATVNAPTLGDKVYATVWNRRARSVFCSVLIHAAIVVLPLLISQLSSGVKPYHVPFGSGTEHVGGGGDEGAVAANAVNGQTPQQPPDHPDHAPHQPRPARKLSGVIFSASAGRENSAEHAAARIVAQLEHDLRHEYTAQAAQTAQATTGNRHRPPGPGGNLGLGGPGPGGYPWGCKDAPIRFIRLKYDGEGWDDGMDDSRAELNLLDFFHDDTNFEVSHENEAITIGQLKKFPKNAKPPFVFMKGESRINSIPPADLATLRTYLQDGGMLFADAGARTWGDDFERFIAQVLPDNPLLDISDDDEIYHNHWQFDNGAPPMWSHAGTRSKGCKINGRWCVFYHPGDVSDGWKTCRDQSIAAFQIGVNVMLYSFKHYGQVTHPEMLHGK